MGGVEEKFSCSRSCSHVRVPVASLPPEFETDLDTFIALPEILSLSQCPACGRSHYWTKSETWISDSLRKCPAALPADLSSPVTSSRAVAKVGLANVGPYLSRQASVGPTVCCNAN